jgi:polar amino acid transport system substrate-binding protein
MQRTTRIGQIVAVLAVFVLVLAGCAPAAPAPAPAADSSAAPTLTIKVGTNAEYRPFEYVDENNNIIGFDIDLMAALAEAGGFEYEFVNTKWDGIFVALANGEFDAVISAVTITDERKETVDFTEPYFNAGQVLAVLADNETITGLESVTDAVRVGVQLGTTADIFLTDNTPAQISRFDELPLALQALGNRDVDAVVAELPVLGDYLKANPDLGGKIVGEPFTDELFGIAVNKGKPEVLEALNAALATIKGNGVYDQIYNKWFTAGE